MWWPLQSSMQELPGHSLASPAFLYHEEESTSPLLTPASFLAGDPCYWSCQGLLPAWDGACQCLYICVSSDSFMCLIPLLNKLPFALGGSSGLFTDCRLLGWGLHRGHHSLFHFSSGLALNLSSLWECQLQHSISWCSFFSSNCTFCFIDIYGMKVKGPPWGQKRANRKGQSSGSQPS